MTNLENAINELIELIRQSNSEQQEQLAGLIRFGTVNLVEKGQTQHCQVKTAAGEILNDVAFLEPYGFTAKPKKKSETLIFNVNGNKFNNVVLNIGSRELRFKELSDGEVAMYDDSGNLLHFKNGGIIDLKAPATMNQTAQTINISGTTAVNVKTKTLIAEADSVSVKAKIATVDAQTTTVNGKVNLAGGGQGVARLGDAVQVNVTSGSSAGTWSGTITSASSEVTAG